MGERAFWVELRRALLIALKAIDAHLEVMVKEPVTRN